MNETKHGEELAVPSIVCPIAPVADHHFATHRLSKQALAKMNTSVRSCPFRPLGMHSFPNPNQDGKTSTSVYTSNRSEQRQQSLRKPSKDDQHCDAILFAHMAT